MIYRDDTNHRKATAILRALVRQGIPPLITNFIVAESHALLLSRLGAGIATNWLTKQIWPVEPVTSADEKKAKEIIQHYTDKEFSYTDATSFAVMERLGLPAAFAFDAHFKQYGLKLLA